MCGNWRAWLRVIFGFPRVASSRASQGMLGFVLSRLWSPVFVGSSMRSTMHAPLQTLYRYEISSIFRGISLGLVLDEVSHCTWRRVQFHPRSADRVCRATSVRMRMEIHEGTTLSGTL